jgi:hypothetical protein
MSSGFADVCAGYATVLEALSLETLDSLRARLSADICFRDPFTDIRGIEPVVGVFARLFETCGDISFRIRSTAPAEPVCFYAWTMDFTFRNRRFSIDGVSEVAFDEAGKVRSHIDHWDAAGGLYERLPLIGAVLRHLRRRLGGHR